MTAKPAAALHSFQTTSPFKQDAPQIGYNTSSYFTPSKDYRGYEGKYKTKHEDLS